MSKRRFGDRDFKNFGTSDDIPLQEELPDELKELIISKIEDRLGNKRARSVTQKNHIYFEEQITKKTARQLINQIQEVTEDILSLSNKYELSEVPKIYLHINSSGGELFSSFNLADTVKRNKIPIVTIIEGSVASGATFISVSGSERLMSKNAFVMIHQLHGPAWGGTFSEAEDDYNNCKLYMDKIMDLYEETTNLKKSQLQKMLKHDLYWDADTCLKYGLIDRII